MPAADHGELGDRAPAGADYPDGSVQLGEFDAGDVASARDLEALADRVFGANLPKTRQYAERLVTTGITHGLVGPKEAPRIWERHLLNCAVVAPSITPHADVADLGSGAGLPGIVLALARPDLTVHLVEPLHRRVVWLRSTVAALELDNTVVHESRAEALVGQLLVRHTTARAVARLSVLTRWSRPLVHAGGSLIAIKGASAHVELEQDWPEMRRAGATSADVVTLGSDSLTAPTRAVVVGLPGPLPRKARRAGRHRR